MKYGAQITTTKDDDWGVSQLIQKTKNGRYTRDTLAVKWVSKSSPNADQKLIEAVKLALAGKIKKTSRI